MDTTINVKPGTKRGLDRLKVDRRESYDHVVARLVKNASVDFEAFLETMEVLADKDAMASLAKSNRDPRVYTLDEV